MLDLSENYPKLEHSITIFGKLTGENLLCYISCENNLKFNKYSAKNFVETSPIL